MISTRRVGTCGASRLVKNSSAAASAPSQFRERDARICSLSCLPTPAPAAAATYPHVRGQQVRTNYSSLIDPGSAHKGSGGGGRAQPWQPEENVDIQKVTQTAIVSFSALLLSCQHGYISRQRCQLTFLFFFVPAKLLGVACPLRNNPQLSFFATLTMPDS